MKNKPLKSVIMDIKLKIVCFILLLICWETYAQLPIPEYIKSDHPRCYGSSMSKEEVSKRVQEEQWASELLEKKERRVQKYLAYCNDQPDWLVSRLQMYWNTKHTTPYINGGDYHHAEGEAPVPTVKFPGTRDYRTNYARPKLEDVMPYMDDPRGLYYINRSTGEFEWTSIQSTARQLTSINLEILRIAKDAAFLYWLTDNNDYAKMSYGVLDTYLTGMYYRDAPIDLSNGHHQTLVGLSTFQVIHEFASQEVSQLYDLLFTYIQENDSKKIPIYEATLQKWADQIIKNGVSFNNWNILQASHVLNIALVLENNAHYSNGKGFRYYLDQVMNQNRVRQWSLSKLINYGYDPQTGIWNESAHYALVVLRDLIHLSKLYDHHFDIDLVSELPILRKAVISSPQYLFPNGYTVGFGDSHYSPLEPEAILYMIENAQKYGKRDDEILFTRMLKTLFSEEDLGISNSKKKLEDLFVDSFKLDNEIKTGELHEFTSPFFYASKASWLVQRQLFDDKNSGLMISKAGSLGNHQHANGVAIELYGHGIPLGCEMGRGSSYFAIDYAEYYSQFPAHNTVIVNGKSSYPEMKSNHPFVLNSSYPPSGESEEIIKGITYSDVNFLEPETYSEQRRVTGIIADNNSGYFVDIFRSMQKNGDDIKHDYFYHNLGQTLTLFDINGDSLTLKPTDKLAFGDGDLMGYDYMWDKKSIETSEDFKGIFHFEMDDKTVNMNVWVKGEEDREIFSALSPKNTALRDGLIPKQFNELPVPTMVVRQNGEAWNRPFVAVYEPTLNGNTGIESVAYFGEGEQIGIHVISKSGKEDYIMSNASDKPFSVEDITIDGSYGVVSQKGDEIKVLLTEGILLTFDSYEFRFTKDATLTFESREGKWFLSCNEPCLLSVNIEDTKSNYELLVDGKAAIRGKVDRKNKTVAFYMPSLDMTSVQLRKY